MTAEWLLCPWSPTQCKINMATSGREPLSIHNNRINNKTITSHRWLRTHTVGMEVAEDSISRSLSSLSTRHKTNYTVHRMEFRTGPTEVTRMLHPKAIQEVSFTEKDKKQEYDFRFRFISKCREIIRKF